MGYLESLDGAVRDLCLRYRRKEWGFKVVGVGSVGLQAYVVLCEGNGGDDPLVLQLKEAKASVLEPYLGPSEFQQRGRARGGGPAAHAGLLRPVPRLDGGGGHGRLLRAPAARHEGRAGRGEDGGARVPRTTRTPAAPPWPAPTRAPATPPLIAGYLGSKDHFDEAVTEFACAYSIRVRLARWRKAEQNQRHGCSRAGRACRNGAARNILPE